MHNKISTVQPCQQQLPMDHCRYIWLVEVGWYTASFYVSQKINTIWYPVCNTRIYLKNYVHGSCFVVFCWGYMLAEFTHILQGYFPDTGDSPHYSDVIMSKTASQITGVLVVYSTVCSGANQRKHQSSASLAFVRGIHW